MSRFFKSKSKKITLPEQKVPRTAEEIQKEYANELANSGKQNYLVFVHSEELKASNQRLLALNQEYAARQALDKQTQEKTETKENTSEQG